MFLFLCNNIKKSQPLLKMVFLDMNIEKIDFIDCFNATIKSIGDFKI